MAKRPVYNVIMKDLSYDHKHYWTKKIRAEIKSLMTQWFRDITSQSQDFRGSAVHCWWSSNKLLVDPDELVVYFLPQRRKSLIRKITRSSRNLGGAGTTFKTAKGMVSEVYIFEATDGSAQKSRLLSNLVFHELMHNKLDADPNQRQANVHNLGGAGATPTTVSSVPTASNKRIMARWLSLDIKQYTGHLFNKPVGKIP